jgi:hypothetical protein
MLVMIAEEQLVACSMYCTYVFPAVFSGTHATYTALPDAGGSMERILDDCSVYVVFTHPLVFP